MRNESPATIFPGVSGSNKILLTLTLVGYLGSCAASAPPPPPATSTVSSSNVKKKPAEDEEEETEVEETSSETPTEPVAAFLGADVGDEETKKAATDCIKQKKFFDRTGAAPGKCSSFKLSDVDCTKDGIRATFATDADKKAFDDMLTGEKYAGFLVDQCIDCKGSSDVFCQNKGTGITGIKILFVKEEPEAIKLQYMIKQ